MKRSLVEGHRKALQVARNWGAGEYGFCAVFGIAVLVRWEICNKKAEQFVIDRQTNSLKSTKAQWSWGLVDGY